MRSNDVVTREDPGDAVANNNNNAGTHGTSFECVLRTKTFRIPPILLPIDEDNPDLRKTNRILVVDRDASGIKSTSEGLWCTEAVDTLPTVSGTVLVDTLGQAIASSFETKYRLPRHEVWTNSKNDDNDDDADYSIMTRSIGTALTYGDISLDSIEEEEFEQFMKDFYHSEEEEFEQFMKDYYHSKAPLTKIGEDIFDSNNNNNEDYSSSIFAYITSCCSLLPLSAYFQINIDDTDFVGNNSREHVIKKSGTGILEASNHSLNEFPSYDEYRKKKQSNSRANNDDRYDEDTVDDDGTEQQRDAPPTPSSFPQNISPIHVKVDNSDAENYRDNTKINSSSRRKNNNNGNSTKKTMFSKRKLRLWWTKKNDKKIGSADAAAVTTTNNNEAVVSASGTTLSLNENIEEKDEKEKMFNVDDDSNNKQEHQKQLKGDGNDDENETEWTSTNDILVLTPSMNRASMALQWANVSYMESPLSSSSTQTSNSSSEIDGSKDKRTENNVELLLVGSDCTEDSVFETVYCKQKTITSILPESKTWNITTSSTIDPPQEPQDDTSINSITIPSPVTQPTQSPTPTPTPKPKIATTAIATTETQLVPPSLLEEDNINTTNTKIVLNNLVSDFFGTIKTNFNKEKMTTKKISKDNNKAGEEEEVEEVQQQQNEDDTNADGLCVGTTFLENSVLEQFETTLSCGGGGYSCDPSSSVLDTVQDSLGASSDRLVFHGRATEATCFGNKNKEKEATTSKEEEEEEVPDEEAYRTNDEQQPIPHNVSVTTIPVCRFVTTEIILPKNANTNIDEKHRPVLRLVTTKSNGDSKQIVYAAKDKNFDKGKRSSSSEKNERKEGKVEDVSKKERKLSAKSASNIQQDVHENSTIALDATDDTDDKRTETETVDYEEMEGSGRIVSIVPLLSSPLSTRMIIETKDSVISAPMGSRF